MTHQRESFKQQLISKFNAHELAARPFHPPYWLLNADAVKNHAETLKDTVRVFYLTKYISKPLLSRLITHVPYICTDGDRHIVTQNGKSYRSLEQALIDHPYTLISPEDRRLGRNQVTASLAKVYAIGGYRTPHRALCSDRIFDCIVISGAGPQFESTYLDFSDFIVSPNGLPSRLQAYAHFGDVTGFDTSMWTVGQSGTLSDYKPFGSESMLLHARGYFIAMTESIYLYLYAFDEMVKYYGNGKSGYFKLTSIGTGFFADVAGTSTNIGEILMPLIVEAAEAVITKHNFQNIAAIEFPDFSSTGLYTPRHEHIGHIRLIAAPRKDVLDFSDEVKRDLMVGLLNPGDCFSFRGNELVFGSVEAMIGNDTTIRLTQNYIWNEKILDEDNWIAVET